MKNKIITVLLTAILMGNFSCQDVLEKYPLDNPSDVTFLQTEQELITAINGVYRSLWYKVNDGTYLNFTMDCLTDIAFDRGNQLFISNDVVNSTWWLSSGMWKQYYAGIAKANYLLENMPKAKENATETVYNQVEGQALFLRAYWYHQLVALFGDVPLITKPQGINDSNVARTPKNQIIDLILADLDNAAAKLPTSWSGANNGRVTKGAALALKARIALYNEKWDMAAQAAKQVMDLNQYSLYPNYLNMFLYAGENCPEVIFSIISAPGSVGSIETTYTAQNFYSRNASGASNKVPSQQLVDSYECTDGLIISESPLYNPAKPFENRDPRLRQTVVVPGDEWLGYQFETHKDSLLCWNYRVSPAVRINNQDATNAFATFTGYCWKKYADIKDANTRNNTSINAIVIRLAEVLLTYAEAKIELNQIDQSVYDAINSIRTRASVNMPVIQTGKSQAEMRRIVRRERKVELALEGLRVFDIYRWKIADKCLSQPVIGRPNKPYNYANQGIPVFDTDDIPNYSAYIDVLRTVRTRTFGQHNYLWPIPQYEMDINRLLEQNPNY